MCLECLRLGAVPKNTPENNRLHPKEHTHKNSHDYFIFDNMNFPLLVQDWTAWQEIMLIQGIMKCGLGNWQDISEQFVKVKSADECQKHYFSVIMKQGSDISYDVILK